MRTKANPRKNSEIEGQFSFHCPSTGIALVTTEKGNVFIGWQKRSELGVVLSRKEANELRLQLRQLHRKGFFKS